MSDATWAGLASIISLSVIGGVKYLWGYVQGNHNKEIQSLKDENKDLKDKLLQSDATNDELRTQLHECNDAKTSLTLTASRVEELHTLTVLQGEKITALEERVEKLSALTTGLKEELEVTSGRNHELENQVRGQQDTISAYEKVFEIFGFKLQEDGSVERIAVE